MIDAQATTHGIANRRFFRRKTLVLISMRMASGRGELSGFASQLQHK
jgi:hypothetical protein